MKLIIIIISKGQYKNKFFMLILVVPFGIGRVFSMPINELVNNFFSYRNLISTTLAGSEKHALPTNDFSLVKRMFISAFGSSESL